MKRFTNALLPILLLTGLVGCEQFLEVELPGQEPRLVLNALLESEDTVKIFLSKSKGILEGREYEGFELVKDAQVTLKTENGEALPFTFVDKSNPIQPNAYYYLAGHEFEANREYEVTAESAGFESVNATVQFPEKVIIKELSYRNLGPASNFTNHDLLEFKLKFDDRAAVNFYELTGRFYGKSTSEENSFYSGDLYPRPVNPAYERDSYTYTGILFDDILLSGDDSEIVFRATIPRDYDLEVTVNFSHVSESYYRYIETVGLQDYNRGDFLSQPVLVYTNIHNGMGILKARNKDQQVIKILLED